MWEYKVISSRNDINDKPNEYQSNISDDKFIQNELNEYGENGWELIKIIPYICSEGVTFSEQSEKYRYIFKRHKIKNIDE